MKVNTTHYTTQVNSEQEEKEEQSEQKAKTTLHFIPLCFSFCLTFFFLSSTCIC